MFAASCHWATKSMVGVEAFEGVVQITKDVASPCAVGASICSACVSTSIAFFLLLSLTLFGLVGAGGGALGSSTVSSFLHVTLLMTTFACDGSA